MIKQPKLCYQGWAFPIKSQNNTTFKQFPIAIFIRIMLAMLILPTIHQFAFYGSLSANNQLLAVFSYVEEVIGVLRVLT